ncbi:MAG: DUF1801 domain-containing protein [Planctomycetota bacterium]|nr:DUF1801 domain-containing protein [Planctomycetota bacterium]
MQSSASTVADYLASLPEDRRATISAIRDVILANLDSDFAEGMGYGMILYHVPHSVYPAGYHCKPSDPLPYIGLASQKNHLAIYMMSLYGDSDLLAWFTKEWKKTGKKLDMGKSCIRFKKLDGVALDVLGETIRRVPASEYIAKFEANLRGSGRDKSKSADAGKSSTKRAKPKQAAEARAKKTKGKSTGEQKSIAAKKATKAAGKKSAKKSSAKSK